MYKYIFGNYLYYYKIDKLPKPLNWIVYIGYYFYIYYNPRYIYNQYRYLRQIVKLKKLKRLQYKEMYSKHL